MSDVDLECWVTAAYAGERFDKAATDLFEHFSRADISRWIQSGELTLDGDTAKPKVRLAGGEHLRLSARRQQREAWQEAQPMSLDIIFEDEHIIVLNKPAGLVVHPGAGNPSGTLVNGLLAHRSELGRLPRAGVVHRLDKDTSGVMVVAASDAAQLALTRAISGREVQRQYLAICEGRMVAGQDVDQPIGRDPHVRTRQSVRDDGKPAFTRFRVEQRFSQHTLVQAILGSGRTHQIRVHAQSIGFPLVGDRRYGARRVIPPGASQALVTLLQQFGRQALHAAHLAFSHPVTAQAHSYDCPMPDDLQALLALLQAHEAPR